MAKVFQWQYVQFAIVSAFFFYITGSTFTSLGVVLPFMIDEMTWSWSQAGTGFSLLALMVGIVGALPAWTIRIIGVKATIAVGGLIMAVGFTLLATTQGLYQYFIGTSLLGLGYTLCAIVPGVYIINNWMPNKRSAAIGAYLTIGGLGGVAGPMIVTTVVAFMGSWRIYWWVMDATILLLVLLAVVFIKASPEVAPESDEAPIPPQEKKSDRVYRTTTEWRFREAIRTPQYYIIVTALTLTMFVGLTVNSFAVIHMGQLGIPIEVAAGALSGHAAINAFSRALGGGLATRIDPKWLIVAALVSEVIGSLALAVADDPLTIALFAFGEGFGFGMCLFASTVIMVNYFGTQDTPAILGTMHTITTAAMLGPTIGGFFADTFGSFAGVFRGYAAVLLVIIVLVALMRPPQKKESAPAELSSSG